MGSNPLWAQSSPDSPVKKLDRRTSAVDSARSRFQNNVDSVANLPHRFTHLTDSLNPALSKYNRKLDSVKRKLTHRIDSLQRLKLPADQYTHILDSVERAGPLKDVSQAEARLASLERKVNEPFTKLNTEVNKIETKINQKLSDLNKEAGGGTSLPGITNLPKLQVPGINPGTLPNTNLNLPTGNLPNATNPLNGLKGLENNDLARNLGNETSELKNITNVPQKELSQLKSIGELGKAEKELGQVNKIEGQAKGYTKDIQKVSNGNLDSLTVTKILENKAMQMGPMKPFQEEAGTINQYKAMAAKGNDSKAMEKLAMEQVQKQAVNHFAGKEKELQSAMSRISKYKQKYSTLTSINDIPKRIPNAMHGKPLMERIVPGLTWQLQKKNEVLVDFNPLLGYRLTGRFTAGGGWNERIGIRHYRIIHYDRIYGPRTFIDFKFSRGFSVRSEVEKMNTLVPSLVPGGPKEGTRQWVWGVFLGIKKEYTFSKHIHGNVQTLYNFLDKVYNTNPYAERFSVRMGFEFLMKKKGPSYRKGEGTRPGLSLFKSGS
jgi:hypothetical protein